MGRYNNLSDSDNSPSRNSDDHPKNVHSPPVKRRRRSSTPVFTTSGILLTHDLKVKLGIAQNSLSGHGSSPSMRSSSPVDLSMVRSAVTRDYITRHVGQRSVTPEKVIIELGIEGRDVTVSVKNTEHEMISTLVGKGRARFSCRYPNGVEGHGVASLGEIDDYCRRQKRDFE